VKKADKVPEPQNQLSASASSDHRATGRKEKVEHAGRRITPKKLHNKTPACLRAELTLDALRVQNLVGKTFFPRSHSKQGGKAGMTGFEGKVGNRAAVMQTCSLLDDTIQIALISCRSSPL
jgi:hypothetical protein